MANKPTAVTDHVYAMARELNGARRGCTPDEQRRLCAHLSRWLEHRQHAAGHLDAGNKSLAAEYMQAAGEDFDAAISCAKRIDATPTQDS